MENVLRKTLHALALWAAHVGMLFGAHEFYELVRDEATMGFVRWVFARLA